MPLNHDARAALAALGYPQHAGQEAVILQGQRGPMTPRGRPGVGSVNSSWTVYGGQRRQFLLLLFAAVVVAAVRFGRGE